MNENKKAGTKWIQIENNKNNDSPQKIKDVEWRRKVRKNKR